MVKERYDQLLAQAMGLSGLNSPCAWRSLVQPTFGRDLVITVREVGEAAEVEVRLAGPGTRAWVMQSMGWTKPLELAAEPPTSQVLVSRRLTSLEVFHAMRAQLARTDLRDDVDSLPERDGTLLAGELLDTLGVVRFRAGAPPVLPAVRHFFTSLRELALGHCETVAVREALAAVRW